MLFAADPMVAPMRSRHISPTAMVSVAQPQHGGFFRSVARTFGFGIQVVPFEPSRRPNLWYHGTSWSDLVEVVSRAQELSPQITYLARAYDHSEPYARGRAAKKDSKAIVLEFESAIDDQVRFSGSPGGLYPAYQATRPIRLWRLTRESKQAIMLEVQRVEMSMSKEEGRALRTRFTRALQL